MGCHRVAGWEVPTPWELLPQHVQNCSDPWKGGGDGGLLHVPPLGAAWL